MWRFLVLLSLTTWLFVKPVTGNPNISVIFPRTNEDNLVFSVIPRAPRFNASFGVDPTSYVGLSVGNSLNYMWSQYDPLDDAFNRTFHQGIIRLSGSNTSFIDVTTSIGPNSCGLVMPIIGGSGFYPMGDANAGWSVEMVVKFYSTSTWAKLIDLGSGSGGIDDLTITWDQNNRILLEQYNNPAMAPIHAQGMGDAFAPQLGVWYHLVWIIQPVNLNVSAANWMLYVNGNQLKFADALVPGAFLTASQGANYPLPVYRPFSYIGKSNWDDPFLNASFDAVRIYDYTLSIGIVQSLADIYNLNQSFPTQTPVSYSTTSDEYTQITDIVPRQPLFNAPFVIDPRTVTSGASGSAGYSWIQTDPSDNAVNQSFHQGIVVLNGTGQYIDLTTVTGPNSIGMLLPVIGGQGFTASATQSVTFEMVVKLMTTPSNGWAKLFDFGTGANNPLNYQLDSVSIGLSIGGLDYLNFNNIPPTLSKGGLTDLPFITVLTPLNQWMHIAIVLQLTNNSTWLGTAICYLNGVQIKSATGITYPLPITRTVSYIGHSGYSGDPTTAMKLDLLRIYDYALSGSIINQLAAQYGLSTLPPTYDSTSNESSVLVPVLVSIFGTLGLALAIAAFIYARHIIVRRKRDDSRSSMTNVSWGNQVGHVQLTEY